MWMKMAFLLVQQLLRTRMCSPAWNQLKCCKLSSGPVTDTRVASSR
eukprot:COSAG02_NODE_58087_length_278_cov_1.094972_1_plen_45_part_01